jgi:hypothetical protein
VANSTSVRSPRLPGKSRRALAVAGLAVWFAVASVASVRLMSRHLAPLDPGDRARTERAMGELARADGGGWTVAHVLYADCGCSARVARHLAETARKTGVHEHVIVVGDSPELEALATSGLRLHHATAESLADTYGLDAAPLLVIADPAGRVRYIGGYTERKQAYAIEDARILAELFAGREVAPLPVFGCAISREKNPGKPSLRI